MCGEEIVLMVAHFLVTVSIADLMLNRISAQIDDGPNF